MGGIITDRRGSVLDADYPTKGVNFPRCSTGGLPLRRRDAIFPEDLTALGRLRADVLVTHEAPSSHRYGLSASTWQRPLAGLVLLCTAIITRASRPPLPMEPACVVWPRPRCFGYARVTCHEQGRPHHGQAVNMNDDDVIHGQGLEEGQRVGRFLLVRDQDGCLHAVASSAIGLLREDDEGTLLMLSGGRMLSVPRTMRTLLAWLDGRG